MGENNYSLPLFEIKYRHWGGVLILFIIDSYFFETSVNIKKFIIR